MEPVAGTEGAVLRARARRGAVGSASVYRPTGRSLAEFVET